MKSQLEQHNRSAVHTKHNQLQCSKKPVPLTQMQQESGLRNEFCKDLCDAMVAAETPWYKPKCQSFVHSLKSNARGKFQTKLHSIRTICLHVMKKRL
jgi:hypothetical protein